MLDFNWKCGELSVYERKLLFDYVLMHKPRIAFEVGSGHGASTYFICQALIKAGRGLLYTCDIRRKPKPIVFKECKDYVQYFKKKKIQN